MKYILYTRLEDGGVNVITPAYNDRLGGFKPDVETEDEYLLRVMKKAISDGRELLTARIAEVAVVPTNRYFRDAWTDTLPGDQLDVDMEKAKVIHMDRLRIERDAKLKELDADVMKALEVDDKVLVQELAAKKQALRDMPQTFDLTVYATPDELQAARPTELDN